MGVLLGSVIYPKALCYFDSFMDSIAKQTYDGFTLLLVNDHTDRHEVMSVLDRYHIQAELIEYQDTFSPAELRIKLLEEAYGRNAEYLVFGDVDDTFSYGRLGETVGVFESILDPNIVFLYNRLLLSDGTQALPEMPHAVSSFRQILEYNFLGLSNTAVRLNALSWEFIRSLDECRTHVFDWYFFSRLLLYGKKGVLLPEASTYYRIHADNYAGIPQMTQKMIDREVYVKKEHYNTLAKYNPEYSEIADIYADGKYLINKNRDKYYWWNLTGRS